MLRERMICSECGAEMNHHASKLDYAEESTKSDPALAAVLIEIHSCPDCGLTSSRIA
jgi:hypothetical protein